MQNAPYTPQPWLGVSKHHADGPEPIDPSYSRVDGPSPLGYVCRNDTAKIQSVQGKWIRFREHMSHRRIASSALLMLILLVPIAGAGHEHKSSNRDVIILEELTATWCSFCATIDPQIVELQEVHNQRLITLTLHPPPGAEEDPLFNEAMRLRAAKLEMDHSRTPAFWINGEFYGEGVIDMNELSKQIMREEARMGQKSDITLNSYTNTDGFHIEVELNENLEYLENTSLTIMIVEQTVELRKGVASNGQTEFHNILLNSISLNLSGNDNVAKEGGAGWSVNGFNSTDNGTVIELGNGLSMDDDVFVIAIHEDNYSPVPLGIVDTMHRDFVLEESSNLWQWLVGLAFLAGCALVFPYKKRDIDRIA